MLNCFYLLLPRFLSLNLNLRQINDLIYYQSTFYFFCYKDLSDRKRILKLKNSLYFKQINTKEKYRSDLHQK